MNTIDTDAATDGFARFRTHETQTCGAEQARLGQVRSGQAKQARLGQRRREEEEAIEMILTWCLSVDKSHEMSVSCKTSSLARWAAYDGGHAGDTRRAGE